MGEIWPKEAYILNGRLHSACNMGLTGDKVNASSVKGLFRYYCGFEFCEFENLCHFLNISGDTTEPAPLHLRKKNLSS